MRDHATRRVALDEDQIEEVAEAPLQLVDVGQKSRVELDA
jgi:hypothetical protein